MRSWLNGLLGGGRRNEGEVEERLRQPERWPGDRLAALLLACGSDRPGRAARAAAELRKAVERIRPGKLVGVEQRVRRELMWGMPYTTPTWAQRRSVMAHLRKRVDDDVAVLCVLSMPLVRRAHGGAGRTDQARAPSVCTGDSRARMEAADGTAAPVDAHDGDR